MGKPFLDDFRDLVTLGSHKWVDESVVIIERTLEDTGKKQYLDLVKKKTHKRPIK